MVARVFKLKEMNELQIALAATGSSILQAILSFQFEDTDIA